MEQLIAESTGKRGVGIVPVDREPLGAIAAYGDDRVFVRLALAGAEQPAADADALAEEAAAAGHPVIRIEIADPIDLAAEFVRWEVATAIAGAVLGDRPVRPAQRRGGQAADEGPARRPWRLGRPSPRRSSRTVASRSTATPRSGSARTATGRSSASSAGTSTGAAPTRTSRSRRSSPRPRPATRRSRASGRTLRDATRCATTAGYGPRFLHSTGQLHKGGAPIGWFLQLTSDHPIDRPIPGWPYTFGRLIDAQAQGDFESIESHDLPIVRVHLADPETDLPRLDAALAEALLGT